MPHEDMTEGIIAGIKRFETHDGNGIRTTLFEGLSAEMQMVP